jgi:tetrapyrrole methylase family protein/MazG family protein
MDIKTDADNMSEDSKLRAPGIWVVGLGPGDWSQLTIGALELVLATRHLHFRTLVHPVVEQLRARLHPGQILTSFDERYERAESFEDLYHGIVETLLTEALASEEPLVYAVPGHPLVGERTVSLLLEAAPGQGVATRVLDGVSFLEPVITALRIDPLSAGLTMLDGAALLNPATAELTDPWAGLSARLHPAGRPLLIGQVYDRRVASACKLWLLERYPEDHAVTVVSAAGTGAGKLRTVQLGELDHTAAFDHLTSIYVPPLDPLHDTRSLASLPYIAARLRAPNGCPWDRKQTMQTLKPHLLEEAHELVAALDQENLDEVVEELGDLTLLITMISQIGEEQGEFDYIQVVEAVTEKLIRRHPHVFGDLSVTSAESVVQNWERIKSGERAESTSALAGVPVSMPSLVASQVMQRKAAALGFDWHDIQDVYAKVEEELREVREAASSEVLEETGDLLFAIVSLCRHLKLDADEALRKANQKFRRRFEAVEALCAARSLDMSTLDARTRDQLWEEAKTLERA